MDPESKKASPLLKWVGGKTQILGPVLENFPKTHNRYFEPFIGGGAVFFRLGNPKSVISDINPRLINFYQHVASHPEGLIKEVSALGQLFMGTAKPQEEVFYELRHRLNEEQPVSVVAAALFLVINKTAFNGLYRENKKGDFNVPFNKFKAVPSFFDEDNLRRASRLLKTASISVSDFADATSEATEGDLVYFDPPYVPMSITSRFTSYSSGGFDEKEQKELLETAIGLRGRGVSVVLSNSYSGWVLENYESNGFRVLEVFASRNVAARSSSRTKVSEALILGQ